MYKSDGEEQEGKMDVSLCWGSTPLTWWLTNNYIHIKGVISLDISLPFL